MSTTASEAAVVGSGQKLYTRAKRIIPGGTQLLSKRPEMFLPELWPAYYSRASGAEVWDLDGRQYLDMSYSGIGSCILGYADPDVDRAVKSAIDNGSMTTLNCPEEVELAELLLELHPWAGMVRYTRSGGEAMSVAVRVARAATGRDKVAFCGYHGWHDWYLAANLSRDAALDGHLLPGLQPSGVPRGLQGTMLPFTYNNVVELDAILAEHGDELAAIVMEPVRGHDPESGFLQHVRESASRVGAVFMIDEITAGWRLASGGAHLVYDVTPDVAVFAKGMSNGYPMAAIIGIPEVMEAAQGSFISSTFWTERIGPTAALATISKHRELRAHERLIAIGTRVLAGWRAAAARHGLAIEAGGIPPLGHFSFTYPNGQAMRTLFTQLMLERGFLATGALYAMLAHTDEHLDRYLENVDAVFGEIARAVADGTVGDLLRAPVAHAGFRRLT
jgi:glutamate-1-semialdehyde aminotransferase